MPQPFNNAVMTNAGARLLTRAQAGEIKIEFTRIAVGNGNYTAAEKTLDALQKRIFYKPPLRVNVQRTPVILGTKFRSQKVYNFLRLLVQIGINIEPPAVSVKKTAGLLQGVA